MISLLLADIEGSVALWEAGHDAMAEAAHRYDELISGATTAHCGRLLKRRGEGDSHFALFPSPLDAVSAALAVQAELATVPWALSLGIRARMAVNVGEAMERDGDFYGPMVNRTARLRDLAAGGQLLVTRSVADALRSEPGGAIAVVDLGRRSLRGLAQPEHVFRVMACIVRDDPFPGARGGARGTLPLPGPLATLASVPLTGRSAEREVLRALWERAAGGERRVAALSGEPGVGKSHLAALTALRAAERGALVLFGRCDEGMPVPYQPLTMAISAWARQATAEEIRVRCGGRLGTLARLVPELSDRIPGIAGASPPGPAREFPGADAEVEMDRFRLYDAVAATLAAISQATPVLLILDDVHWATPATIELLRHLMRDDRPAPLLVLLSYRDTEVGEGHPLRAVLAQMRRHSLLTGLHLRGLGEAEVRQMVESLVADQVSEPAGLAHLLHEETGGNPLFVGEVIRHLIESGLIATYEGLGAGRSATRLMLPDSVREVIEQRLGRLSPAAARVLQATAVAEEPVTFCVLRALALDAAGVERALDEVLQAQLIRELGDGTFVSAHDLIRETVLAGLPLTGRRRLHAELAAALLEASPRQPPVDSLAHHYVQAAPLGYGSEAATYCLLAGRQALERLAYRHAATVLERGVAVAERAADAVAPELRADLLLALGRARERTRDLRGMRDAARRAGECALAGGSVERLAEAALLAVQWTGVSRPNPAVAALCRQALDRLGPDHQALRAQVLAWLAYYLAWSEGRSQEAQRLAREALGLARQMGDATALVRSLNASITSLIGGTATRERQRLCEEFVALAARSDNPFYRTQALFQRGLARLVLGDVTGFQCDAVAYGELAERVRWWGALATSVEWRAMTALMAGDPATAEEHATAVLELAGDADDYTSGYTGQLFFIRYEQGRLEELIPLIEQTTQQVPGLIAFRAGLLLAWAMHGQMDRARAGLEEIAAQRFAGVPRDLMFPCTAALLAETVTLLGDGRRARTLYGLLAGHSGQLVVAAQGVACLGAVDRWLGMLATTMGDWSRADRHFRDALRLEQTSGSALFAARTGVWQAQSLLARRNPDLAAVRGHLRTATEVAEELRLPGLRRHVAWIEGRLTVPA